MLVVCHNTISCPKPIGVINSDDIQAAEVIGELNAMIGDYVIGHLKAKFGWIRFSTDFVIDDETGKEWTRCVAHYGDKIVAWFGIIRV